MHMSLISKFINKCLSIFRLGHNWFSKLIGSTVEAGRTISYVETVNPSQSDTLHKEIKQIDIDILRKEFEKAVRKSLKYLRFGKVKVAIDTTEDPYWGKNGFDNTRAKVHVKSDESWQYVNLSIVEPKFIPLMSLPYTSLDNLDDLVIDLLEYLGSLPLNVELVLFDRGFYHSNLIYYLEGYKWPYLMFIPRTDFVKECFDLTKRLGIFKHEMPLGKNKTKLIAKTKIVICKGVGKTKNGKLLDWCFATNQRGSLRLVWVYRKRWNIETGFRIQDEARIKSKSSSNLIRYFYHLISMILILMWRINNQISNYLVFKRYLKYVEVSYLKTEGEPPPNLEII